MYHSRLIGVLLGYYMCSILTENDENSLLSMCSLLKPRLPGLETTSETDDWKTKETKLRKQNLLAKSYYNETITKIRYQT